MNGCPSKIREMKRWVSTKMIISLLLVSKYAFLVFIENLPSIMSDHLYVFKFHQLHYGF